MGLGVRPDLTALALGVLACAASQPTEVGHGHASRWTLGSDGMTLGGAWRTPDPVAGSSDWARSTGVVYPSDGPRPGDPRVWEPNDAGWLGVELGATEGGVVITGIVRRSPAERAGLLVGDTLVALDGEPVASPHGAVESIHAKGARTEMAVAFRRGADSRLVRAKLSARPNPEAFLKSHLTGQPATRLPGLVPIMADSSTAPGAPTDVVPAPKSVVMFWSVSSSSCRLLLRKLDDLRNRGVEVLAIAPDTPAEVAATLDALHIEWPAFVDPSQRGFVAYHAFWVPMLVAFGNDGRVLDVVVGYNNARVEQVGRTLAPNP